MYTVNSDQGVTTVSENNIRVNSRTLVTKKSHAVSDKTPQKLTVMVQK